MLKEIRATTSNSKSFACYVFSLPNFQICNDSTCLFITVSQLQLHINKVPPLKNSRCHLKNVRFPFKMLPFQGTFDHFRFGRGGGGVSLPTLADLRLKSLELPSRSALAAQLRAERIQRATLARQKQLQRLVRGTRAENI